MGSGSAFQKVRASNGGMLIGLNIQEMDGVVRTELPHEGRRNASQNLCCFFFCMLFFLVLYLKTFAFVKRIDKIRKPRNPKQIYFRLYFVLCVKST